MVELDQRRQRALGELARPVAHRAHRRQARQLAEARDQRIAGDVAQVLQPARAHVQQRQRAGRAGPHHNPRPSCHTRPQPLRNVELSQLAAEQFQPALRGQLLVGELHVQRALDQTVQTRYAQSH
jgi:hypothetical protein